MITLIKISIICIELNQKIVKICWENEMSQPEYISNEMLNRNKSFDQIEKMTCRSLQKHKSCGFDKIPNGIPKTWNTCSFM